MGGLPTRGQLERRISQDIQAFYRRYLGHQPSKVTCQIFTNKITLILENSITNAELVLIDEGKNELAKKVRLNLNEAIQPKLKELIEEITAAKVADILSAATLDTGRTAIICILSDTPKVRNLDSMSKIK